MLDAGLDIGIVLFYYSKAFDTVPHRPLLAKLQSVDLHPHVLKWIASYLCEKTQYVCVGGATSQVQPVISGVPQGSVLCPLVFNFYINDISFVPLINSRHYVSLCGRFVMYCPIRSQIDFFALQADIDSLCVWTDENCLNFNAAKYKYMIISRKRQYPAIFINCNQ
jgi:hypothetical protein